MIDASISRKMIDRAKEIVDFNINLMDGRGIIIASTDHKRVGTFHEGAMKLLAGDESIIEIHEDSDLLGVHQGINVVLNNKNEKIGVLGITGQPAEVRPFAQLLKFAMEIMFEHETMKQKNSQQFSQSERLVNGIIYSNLDENSMQQLARDLNYNMNLYRIPIMVFFDDSISFGSCLECLNHSKYQSSQDIKCLSQDGTLVIFKAFDKISDQQIYGEYRNMIKEYLESLLTTAQRNKISYRVSVGTFAKRIRDYHEAVKRAFWVDKNFRQASALVFFYDHLSQYIKDLLPVSELHEIFSFFTNINDKKFLESMTTICESLCKNNYNLAETSNELFIHKNTLFLKMSKFKDIYGINPIQNMNDRVFFEFLSYYYQCTHETEMTMHA